MATEYKPNFFELYFLSLERHALDVQDTTQVCVRVPNSIVAELDVIARLLGIARSAVVRELVIEGLPGAFESIKARQFKSDGKGVDDLLAEARESAVVAEDAA